MPGPKPKAVGLGGLGGLAGPEVIEKTITGLLGMGSPAAPLTAAAMPEPYFAPMMAASFIGKHPVKTGRKVLHKHVKQQSKDFKHEQKHARHDGSTIKEHM